MPQNMKRPQDACRERVHTWYIVLARSLLYRNSVVVDVIIQDSCFNININRQSTNSLT